MFKSLAYLSLTASAVTLYIHIRNHDFPHFFSRSKPEPVQTESKGPGEIVIVPLRGNNLNDRWQGEPGPSATPVRR